MKKLIIILVVFLAGCIGNKTFTWEIDALTEDDVMVVDCSEQLNKTDDDFGVECPIEITD
ncbi:hypothetical protein ACTWQB_10655 [Piscibacillus sp. B03]|uniref:hypothetical protein n=1 Tax=Piscibacillus sp. B03 TaxID=3457430 RepID=UPI003FCC879E